MDPISDLALATAAFVLTHCISSTPLRAALADSVGERAYRLGYSFVSLITLGWMIWAYARAPLVPLWSGAEFKAWAVTLMPIAMVVVACGFLTRNPSAVMQEDALETNPEPRGIFTVTRHPILWGVALWALLHLIARGDAAALIFFGGFLILAVGGTFLIDARRAKALDEKWRRFAAATSSFPFAAVVQGRTRFDFAGIGWWRVLAGLVLYAVILYLHPWLFGVRPY